MLHFFYFLFIQIQNVVTDATQNWSVLLGQFENLFISSLLILSRKRWITFSVLIYICFNQIYFNVFHQNLSITDINNFNLQDYGYLLSSFFLEVNFLFFINFFLCILILRFFDQINFIPKRSRILGLVSIFLIGLTYFSQYYWFPSKVTSHPILSLVNLSGEVSEGANYFQGNERKQRSNFKLNLKERLALKKEFDEIKSSNKNTIFIILESVGSLQAIQNGEVNSELFPFLHSMQKSMFIFDRLYNVYPGTTRSHMAISSGMAPTKSGLFDLSDKKFIGPSIASQFKAKQSFTMLISAMGLGFEELDKFYSNLAFDFIFDPDKNLKGKKRENPWGVDEKIALEIALKEVSELNGRTFYLQLLTNSTHYPYLVNRNENIKEDKERYISAARYTDKLLFDFFEKLRAMKILENTRIIITGDHGEAFGEYHKDNFTHRNYLYEENIRNFLIVWDSQFENGPLTVSKIGSIKDIYATVFSQEGSLFNPDKKEEIQFFHKNSWPPQWGLIDGNFKFISTHDGRKQEIYWLKDDPHEQRNLKALYPNRLKRYQAQTKKWFISEDENFKKNLK